MFEKSKEVSSGELHELLQHLVEIVEESRADRPLVYTSEQAAKRMEISVPTLREHFLCRPDFPRVNAGRKVLIPRQALEEWLNDRGRKRVIPLRQQWDS
jgi:hypothetical protein